MSMLQCIVRLSSPEMMHAMLLKYLAEKNDIFYVLKCSPKRHLTRVWTWAHVINGGGNRHTFVQVNLSIISVNLESKQLRTYQASLVSWCNEVS